MLTLGRLLAQGAARHCNGHLLPAMPALSAADLCAPIPRPTLQAPRVLSVHDPVFPLLPFAGLLSVGRERGWLHDGLFPWFTAQAQADGAAAATRCSYTQAREAILNAQRLHGDADLALALLSGGRKSIPNLGVMGLGMLSHGTRGEAIRFGLAYQLVAGSMLRLQLQLDRDGDGTAAIETQALFCDEELRPFLDLDHLMTALNAIRQLPTCDARFEVRRLELAFAPRGDGLTQAIEQAVGAPVVFGAESSRIVFDAHQVETPLRFHDHALLVMSRQACEQELAGRGVHGEAAGDGRGALQHLFSHDGELRSLSDAAQQLKMSLRSLHRLLAREGIDYSLLADRHRQERAQRLLRQGVGTQAVAEAVGFSDSRCFRRAFRRWTGMAPSEYRGQAIQH
ncbi:MAG: helix-turn-helix domain-containing protein [Proteobacteria bacterium]|nr:helix-turn-helix domain-containing protein [Pseudomonadota bacterium]